MKEKFLFFDIMKVLSCIIIVYYHLASKYYWFNPYFKCYDLGSLGCSIFIIISGALLYLNYPKIDNFKQFYLKRIIRLYPLYIIMAIIGMLWYMKDLTYIFNYIIPNFNILYNKNIDGSLWFIGLVFLLYLIYPVLLESINKYPVYTFIIITCIGLFFKFIFAKSLILDYTNVKINPLSQILEFTIGIYITKYKLYPKIISNDISKYLNKFTYPVYLCNFLIIQQINNVLISICLIIILSLNLIKIDENIQMVI
jgi:peptidoglycan/LPS O-acetylase OafA/YrhL